MPRPCNPFGSRLPLTRHPQLPPRVLIRDVLIFQLKLWLDGVKDILLSPVSIGATVLDLLRGSRPQGYRLYSVLRAGERFDRWLSLYAAANAAETTSQGLFGASRAGDETLLGRLEELTGGERDDGPPARK